MNKYKKFELLNKKDTKKKKRKRKKVNMLEPMENMAKQSSFCSLSGFEKKSTTPVKKYSEHSSNSHEDSNERSFEFGILGKGYPSGKISNARSPFLKRFQQEKVKEFLPSLRPVTPGILNPVKIRKAIVKGRFIDLEKPSEKMIEFYGATSKYYFFKFMVFKFFRYNPQSKSQDILS